jgi:hypothetical protein
MIEALANDVIDIPFFLKFKVTTQPPGSHAPAWESSPVMAATRILVPTPARWNQG